MVTGGSGLVGQGIKACIDKEEGNEKWIFLTSKDGDLRDKEQTKAIFEKYKPTHVIHLAARVGGLFSNMKYKVEFWRENVAINDNVLQLSHECASLRRLTTPPHAPPHAPPPPPPPQPPPPHCAALAEPPSPAASPQVWRQEGRLVPVDVHLPR